jgi:hypothetical protein
MNRYLSIVVAFVLTSTVILAPAPQAQEQDGGAPGDWLAHYTAARTLGLGGAFVAAADEPLGVVWNPAALSYMFQNEAHFETARLFEGTSVHSLSFAVPSRRLPSFAVTVLSLSSGDFERTNELNESLGTFSEGDLAFLLSLSKPVSSRLALGANVKVVRQTVEEFGATGVGGDVGVLYDLTPTVRVGASVINLGGPTLTLRQTSEKYPGQFRWGAAARVLRGRGLVSAELDHSSGFGTSIHAGTEYWLYPSVALRLGYDDRSPAAGLSYRFPSGLRVDYALSDRELGMTHRVGVSFRFGGFFADSEADPTVFSPLGQQAVTKFHLKAKTKAATTDWRLEIFDKSKRVVREFGGKGEPPSHVMWDGKDVTGLPLPDGIYRYVLVVNDLEGRSITGRERWVEITTAGPEGSVPVAVN